MAKTIALSIGSEISACLVMAASRVSPMARKALTTAPVPRPDGAAEDEGGDRGGDDAGEDAGDEAGDGREVEAAEQPAAGGQAGQEADQRRPGGEGQHGRVEEGPHDAC